jgi:hypothetical protein
MRKSRTRSLLAGLMMVILANGASGQGSRSLELNLSLLRGAWEVHTFYDKWELLFDSDREMLFDREPADYTLAPNVIRIRDEDGSTDYPYTIDGKSLTLTLPDGTQRTYRRTAAGSSEQLVRGDFVAPADSSMPEESFTFDGDRSFVFHTFSSGPSDQGPSGPGSGHVTMVRVSGFYRVVGDLIVLTFGDTTSSEASVRTRDDGDSVGEFVLYDRMFESTRPVASAEPPEPAYFPDQPVEPFVPTYIPPHPPSPVRPPVGSPLPAKPETKERKPAPAARPQGNTRGKPGDR